jgi:hypothetical protein
MNYSTQRYIYPPRPKNAIPDSELSSWDDGTLIGQPKINGSNCVLFTNGERVLTMNRHNQRLTNFRISDDEVFNLYKCKKGEWLVLNGEYLNKSKMDENRQVFNHKLIIFDLLVLNNDYLVGKTFGERITMLDELYGTNDSEKDYLHSISDNVYRVKSYNNNFKPLFDRLMQIDMIEGLVLKRRNARLEIGNTEDNNTKSQIKARKKTKSYKF